jgi:hypothetical protein
LITRRTRPGGAVTQTGCADEPGKHCSIKQSPGRKKRNGHGAELACPTVTYLVTDGPVGLQISLLAARGT